MRARAASIVTDPRLDTPRDAKLAVLGAPIAHSKSPLIHDAAYRELGLEWSYGRREMQANELGAFLRGLPDDWRGLSLTMPLKEEARRLATVVDPIAELSGVVNTLLRLSHGGWAGFNTDVPGLTRALRAKHLDASRTIVLGAGATAVSAALAAMDLGAKHVLVLARRPQAAEDLVRRFGDHAAGRGTRMWSGMLYESDPVNGSRDAQEISERPTLIISTLPGSGVEWERVPVLGRAVSFDVAYSPWPSALQAAASSVGGIVHSGIGMLIEQAILQVRIFVNGDPSLELEREDNVRRAIEGALEADEAHTVQS